MGFGYVGCRDALARPWRAPGGVLGACLLALLVMPPGHARMHAGPGVMDGGRRLGGGGAAPLDGFTDPSGAYSFRKLKSTYAGSAIRIRRASDNAELDINFLGFTGFTGAPWDEASALAHCAATSCFARTWYSQDAAARHLEQATAANQPALIFNCTGSLPCLSMTTATMGMSAAGNVTPATGLVSFSIVAARTVFASNCPFLRENGNNNRLLATGAANTWGLGPTGPTLAVTDGAWHAANAVLSPTVGASVINVDGTEATGTGTPNTTAGTPSTFGTASTTCRLGEAVFWDNYTLTPAERAALVGNQRGFWGTP